MSTVKAVVCGAIVFALLSGFFAMRGNAQQRQKDQEDLRKEIRELKQGQEEIRKEVLEIKQMLLARQPPARPSPPERISIADRPSRGNETARVVVVEFSAYQCPYCSPLFPQTL